MKKTLNIGIGGKSFIIDEDAHARLKSYLDRFRSRLTEEQGTEVMNDIEARIAELLLSNLGSAQQSVSLALVNRITAQLGMPDGKPEFENNEKNKEETNMSNPVKKLYLDVENRKIGGVCSGLAAYLDIDVTLIRIIFVALLLGASFGFWLYLIIWIVAPKAMTPAQKCELRGIEANAENMAKFTDSSK